LSFPPGFICAPEPRTSRAERISAYAIRINHLLCAAAAVAVSTAGGTDRVVDAAHFSNETDAVTDAGRQLQPHDAVGFRREIQPARARADGGDALAARRPELVLAAHVGAQLGCSRAPSRPVDVNLAASARAQPLARAVGRGFRERGQDVQLARVALEEHLGHARRAAEVAVDLERRGVVEQVREGLPGAE